MRKKKKKKRKRKKKTAAAEKQQEGWGVNGDSRRTERDSETEGRGQEQCSERRVIRIWVRTGTR